LGCARRRRILPVDDARGRRILAPNRSYHDERDEHQGQQSDDSDVDGESAGRVPAFTAIRTILGIGRDGHVAARADVPGAACNWISHSHLALMVAPGAWV